MATVITVTPVAVMTLFSAHRGTFPSSRTLRYASMVNPPSGTSVSGRDAASASGFREVTTAQSTGTSQLRARTARIAKATTFEGVIRERRLGAVRVVAGVVVAGMDCAEIGRAHV